MFFFSFVQIVVFGIFKKITKPGAERTFLFGEQESALSLKSADLARTAAGGAGGLLILFHP